MSSQIIYRKQREKYTEPSLTFMEMDVAELQKGGWRMTIGHLKGLKGILRILGKVYLMCCSAEYVCGHYRFALRMLCFHALLSGPLKTHHYIRLACTSIAKTVNDIAIHDSCLALQHGRE